MHQPEQLACLPRHHPLFPKPSESYHTFPEHIPEHDWAYSLSTPTPVVARRGQALVFTQALLHTGKIAILSRFVAVRLANPKSITIPGWRNFDIEPRKGCICSWAAADVLFGPTLASRFAGGVPHFERLHAALKRSHPGREHIVPPGREKHAYADVEGARAGALGGSVSARAWQRETLTNAG